MPRTPYATEIYDTQQKSARVPANSVGYIVIHHAATESFEAVIRLEMGLRQVSSTVIVKDGQVASMMDEVWRAWSLSSQFWDSVSLSSETCNSGGAAEGWPISDESYVTLAKIVADWCRRYSIPCDRVHIMGHREVFSRYGASYPTACPGGTDLDRLVAMAQAELAPKRKKDGMTQLYVNTGTYANGAATASTVYARAGGGAGTSANWIEYTRGAAFGKPDDPAALDFTAHGPHQPVTAAVFASLKAAFLEPVKVTGGELAVTVSPDPTMLAAQVATTDAVKSLGPKIDATTAAVKAPRTTSPL